MIIKEQDKRKRFRIKEVVHRNGCIIIIVSLVLRDREKMNFGKKFRKALVKVLQDGTFKNARALAIEAEVDQGGLSKFLAAMEEGDENEEEGGRDSTKQTKKNLTLQTVGKLVDCMGGRLVFPWDASSSCDQVEFDLLKEEYEALKTKFEAVKVKLEEAKNTSANFEMLANEFRSLLAGKINAPVSGVLIDERVKNKSCA